MLIRAYQISGHSIANLDPLALEERAMPISLDPSLYGFSEDDMDRDFFIGRGR